MNELLPLDKIRRAHYFSALKHGNERGLDHYYKLHSFDLFNRANNATKDSCISQSIVQEAFFKLWLFREKLIYEKDISSFLKFQVKNAVSDFYRKTDKLFQKSLLRLDDIEDYQQFMHSHEVSYENEIQLEKDDEDQNRLNLIYKVLPILNKEEQLLIKLCLQFSFSYKRIANYLGGISDYQVAIKVEKIINKLGRICNSNYTSKEHNPSKRTVAECDFNDYQEEIFRMRYQLKYSFEEIAKQLKLPENKVKLLFIEAHAKLKTDKISR
ncbi:sigma-70 family RNA polymerase sigma factor [Sphingobacterium sp. HJSM2_6]|uniref:sigma-70 family RNA polymerase sigma factor n=1 Tax=Sphingobacterium sp. HJSM2_6 TaxID=3366264 RepID=UPI003BE1A392